MRNSALLSVVFIVGFSLSSQASVECTARMDNKSITLQDHGKMTASLKFRDAKAEISCPYSRFKVENKTEADGTRVVRVQYRKNGKCRPKQPPGTASRKDVHMVISIKGPSTTARFEDPKKDSHMACDLKNFRLSAFGLK